MYKILILLTIAVMALGSALLLSVERGCSLENECRLLREQITVLRTQ